MKHLLLAGALLLLLVRPGLAIDLSDHQVIDLTHTYNEDTLYWPTSPSRFELKELSFGKTEGGWFYSAYALCTPEHGGTHLDAPMHFASEGDSVDEIWLKHLIAPAVVIDVSDKANSDSNYRLTVEDVEAFEAEHGKIEPDTIVLLRTDWSERWPNAKAYLGDDTPGDASKLSFPSFGEDAAKLLINERDIALLGVDTASIDYGRSKDFPVHRIAAMKNIGGLENLKDLDLLPPTGATVIALPMKVGGGSGAPVRVVALVEAGKGHVD